MLALQAYTYEKDMKVSDDSTDDALEARSRAERLQADRVWSQEPKSLGAHELSSAEWLQLLSDMPELASTRLLRWTRILRGREFHFPVVNASGNERSTAIYLKARRLTDRVRRQNQPDNHDISAGSSRESTSDVMEGDFKENIPKCRLVLLIGPTLIVGILPKMDYQELELRMAGEILEENDVIANGCSPIGRVL